jgi:hypothetical protein
VLAIRQTSSDSASGSDRLSLSARYPTAGTRPRRAQCSTRPARRENPAQTCPQVQTTIFSNNPSASGEDFIRYEGLERVFRAEIPLKGMAGPQARSVQTFQQSRQFQPGTNRGRSNNKSEILNTGKLLRSRECCNLLLLPIANSVATVLNLLFIARVYSTPLQLSIP